MIISFREATFVLGGSGRYSEDHRGTCRAQAFGSSELNSTVTEEKGTLLRTPQDSGHRDSRFAKLRRVAGTMLSLGSL